MSIDGYIQVKRSKCIRPEDLGLIDAFWCFGVWCFAGLLRHHKGVDDESCALLYFPRFFSVNCTFVGTSISFITSDILILPVSLCSPTNISDLFLIP